MIYGAAAHDLEILRGLAAFGLGVIECVGKADAVKRVLRNAVDEQWRLDADDLVKGRHDVIDMVELRARSGVGLDLGGPTHRHRIAGAAEVRGEKLRAFVWSASSPPPTGVIHVVGLGRPQNVQPTDFVQCGEVLRNGRRDVVLREQLADRAVLAFRRRSVIAPDVQDQRVVTVAEPVHLVDEPADLSIDVLRVAGRNLHQTALKRLLAFGDAVPRGKRRISWRELRVLRYPALCLGTCEHPLSIQIPAVVEFALILVRPLLHNVMWAVNSAARPVHEERLVLPERLVTAKPADGIIGQVLRQVIALFGSLGRMHDGRVAYEVRFVLRGLASEEAVEVFKAVAGRPIFEGAGGGGLLGGCVVPLAPSSGSVAVIAQNLRTGRAALRHHAWIAIPVIGEFRNLSIADAVMIAPGQQRRARRRTHRGRVKAVIRHAGLANAVKGGCVDLAAEGTRQPRAGIVDQDYQDVWCALSQAALRRLWTVDGLLHG